VETRRFWTHIPKHRPDCDERELVEEYQRLFEDAVRLQMRSDVPVGLFLSSGVDSGALLALMTQHANMPVKTFTIGFQGGEQTNEVDDARETAQAFGAEHYTLTLSDSDYLSYFQRYMRDLEEPVAHEPAPAFYFLAKLASDHVKVALSGQGADEPWAGYDRYLGLKASTLYSRMPSLVTEGVSSIVERIPLPMERIKRGASSLGEKDILTRFTKMYSFFSAEMKSHLYKGELKANFDKDPYEARHSLRRLQADVEHLDPLSQMLYIDTRASLPDDLLMVGDKTSMANSLEVRVPFLDYRLIEFVENLPPGMKLNGITGKYLHKKAMTKWLPKETVYRKKKGFAHPVAAWLRGPLKPLLEDCLLSGDSHVAKYFEPKYMRQLITEHQQGTSQFMRHLFLLMSVELWHREFVARR
jgi:asparagine synthase (glutamine-hydrolysing)